MSVSLHVTIVNPEKSADPIEMPFGLSTWMGPMNHGVQIPRAKGQF